MSGQSPNVRIRVAAVILQDSHILLVQHTKDGESYWMLPGGGVDFGETLAEALVRELREELGLAVRPGRLLLASDAIAPDRSRHMVNLCFSAEILEGTPVLGSDPRLTDWAFMPVDELMRVPLRPAFAGDLLAALESGSEASARYLGNLWTDALP